MIDPINEYIDDVVILAERLKTARIQNNVLKQKQIVTNLAFAADQLFVLVRELPPQP